MPKSHAAVMDARGAEIRKRRVVIMFRVVDKTTGAIVGLGNARFEAKCPDCGGWHTINLLELARLSKKFDLADCEAYCLDCWEKRKESSYND